MPKQITRKEDWIKLGYGLFSERGISGIIIEKMAKKLNCNKSSFYWYFKSKEEFIDQLIDHWVKAETDRIIHKTETIKNPHEKFEYFLSIAFKNDPYLEFIFFLKRYGKKNKKIQSIIDDIDSKRLLYSSKLLKEIGYSESEATVKAKVFYKYLIGYHEMIKNKKQQKDYLTEVKEELKHFLNI